MHLKASQTSSNATRGGLLIEEGGSDKIQGSHSDLETWKNLETWENLEKATFFVQNLENGGLGQLTER